MPILYYANAIKPLNYVCIHRPFAVVVAGVCLRVCVCGGGGGGGSSGIVTSPNWCQIVFYDNMGPLAITARQALQTAIER